MKNGYIYSANVDVYYPDIKFVEMPFLAWIKHMNGFQKGFWRYDR